jgi:5-methylcytosine-specific restriction enzyme A
MKYDNEAISEAQMKREKERARHLRQSEWWLRKVHKGVCYYCQRQVGRAHLTMDHVVPISRGGRSNKGNIVPACKECNTKKKYLVPVEWEEYLDTLAKRSLVS